MSTLYPYTNLLIYRTEDECISEGARNLRRRRRAADRCDIAFFASAGISANVSGVFTPGGRSRGTNVESQPNVRGPRGATSWPSTSPTKRPTPSCSHVDGFDVVVSSCKIDATYGSTSVRNCSPKYQQNEQMSRGSGVNSMQPYNYKNYTIALCVPLAAPLVRFDSVIATTRPPTRRAFSGMSYLQSSERCRTTRVSPVWPLATATCARRENSIVILKNWGGGA